VSKELLTTYLKPEHRQTGLYLEEDKGFVYLKRGDRILGVWLATKVTVKTMLCEADREYDWR